MRGLAYLEFAELVVARGREDLFAEAVAGLDELGGDELLPVLEFRRFAVRALMSEARGDRETAAQAARRALVAASKTESPFRWHRKLGLVGSIAPDLERRLRALAS